jgi:hypothetical protein
MANRQEILDQFAQNFGLVPDYLAEMPDPVLEQYTNTLTWVLSDTTLSARDKALVAIRGSFGYPLSLLSALPLSAVCAGRNGRGAHQRGQLGRSERGRCERIHARC